MNRMPDLTQASECDLIRHMTTGNEEAFTILYRRHQAGVYRFALHMSGSADVAEEVTQEVFMFLIRGAGQYDRTRGAFSSFLFGVARNHVLRRLDRERVYGEPPEEEPANSSEDTLEAIVRNRRIDCLRKAVLALPEHYREVLVLCDLEELDYAGAAEALSCPVGTVRSRLNRARTLLAWRLRSMEGCPA